MKKFENGRISDQELECVSGGYVGEMWDLTKKILSVQPGALKGFKYIAQIAQFLQSNTGVGKLTGPINCALSYAIEAYMNRRYHVKTKVSVGFLGSGWGDKPNQYTYHGRSISHGEAMALIR